MYVVGEGGFEPTTSGTQSKKVIADWFPGGNR